MGRKRSGGGWWLSLRRGGGLMGCGRGGVLTGWGRGDVSCEGRGWGGDEV